MAASWRWFLLIEVVEGTILSCPYSVIPNPDFIPPFLVTPTTTVKTFYEFALALAKRGEAQERQRGVTLAFGVPRWAKPFSKSRASVKGRVRLYEQKEKGSVRTDLV